MSGSSLVDKSMAVDVCYFLPDHNLNYTDKMAMAHGVEVRVPLISNAMIDFALDEPASSKVRGSGGKWILRQAARGLVPSEILSRPKSGFGLPLKKWLHNEMRELIEDTCSSSAVLARGIFDHGAVRRLIEQDRQGKVDYSYPILAIACIELWARALVD